MKTIQEIQTYIQGKSSDTSSKMQTFIQGAINTVIKRVKRRLKINYEISSTTITSVASTGIYDLPMNFRQFIDCKITIDSNDYPIIPIPNRDQWNQIVSGDATTSDYPVYCFIHPTGTSSGYKIEFYPALSSSGNIITVRYYSYFRDLVANDFTDKTAGTVSINNGAAAVTGAGTAFASTDVGRYIRFDTDGFWYKILSVGGATALTLDRNFEGTSIAGGAYKIGTVPPIPEGAAEVVERFVLQSVWEKREDMSIAGGKASYYEDRAEKLLKELKKDIEELYDSPYVNTIPMEWTPVDPNDYPTGLT